MDYGVGTIFAANVNTASGNFKCGEQIKTSDQFVWEIIEVGPDFVKCKVVAGPAIGVVAEADKQDLITNIKSGAYKYKELVEQAKQDPFAENIFTF